MEIRKRFDEIFDKYILNIEAGHLLEVFFISAITSLLGIRAFLRITGYPQVGGGGLHIAHMLWGGFFMLAAIILMLSFLNQSKYLPAMLAGIGFGTFIDELGKFITSDNDYFFKPAVGLIYVVFVILFLLIRQIGNRVSYSSKTYVVNSLEGIKQILISDLDHDEKERALKYLGKYRGNVRLKKLIRNLLEEAKSEKRRRLFYEKYLMSFRSQIKNTISSRLISRFLLLFFAATSVINLLRTSRFIITGNFFDYMSYGYILTSLVIGFLVLVAVFFRIARKNILYYSNLQRANLVSIFLLQYFLFVENQLYAIVWLLIYVSVYYVLASKMSALKITQTK